MVEKNKQVLREKYPKILKTYKGFSTEGLSLAVFEELVLCIAGSTLAFLLDVPSLWYLWLGAFIACTLHFLVHIAQVIITRKYIPTVITSVICLPISIWIIYQCMLSIESFDLRAIVWMIIGIVIVAINLRFAQKMIGWFTDKAGLESIV